MRNVSGYDRQYIDRHGHIATEFYWILECKWDHILWWWEVWQDRHGGRCWESAVGAARATSFEQHVDRVGNRNALRERHRRRALLKTDHDHDVSSALEQNITCEGNAARGTPVAYFPLPPHGCGKDYPTILTNELLSSNSSEVHCWSWPLRSSTTRNCINLPLLSEMRWQRSRRARSDLPLLCFLDQNRRRRFSYCFLRIICL